MKFVSLNDQKKGLEDRLDKAVNEVKGRVSDKKNEVKEKIQEKKAEVKAKVQDTARPKDEVSKKND